MSRILKSYTGFSFIDYLTEVRMNEAVKLLSTHTRINDIASLVGYHSRNTFLVNFRNHTSLTPSEYRVKILRLAVTNENA
jgi:two-component system response regulator YesN